jgi:putative phage-type endonuclease
MIFHDVKQGSPEWFSLRTGKITASCIKDLFMKPDTETYKKAIYKIAYERLTGNSPETFKNGAMERGNELEPSARQYYEGLALCSVKNGGFCESEQFQGWLGVSPDGLIDNGVLEIKCPLFSTHIGYLLNGGLPSIYKYQVHTQIWVTGSEHCDFISYHPELRPLRLRVYRDESIIKELETKVINVINEVTKIMEQI